MHISVAGLALIERFEGFSPTPYLCPAGWWTIGYGHVIRDDELPRWRSIDQPTARNILREDIAVAEAAVIRLIRVPLTQNQFDALVCFTFNVGAGALQRSTLRRVINRGDHDEVPDQLMRWIWGGGRKLPGLVLRRRAEAELYRS